MDNLDKHEEELIKNLMSKSKLEIPFSDFENNVMAEIENSQIRQSTISKDVKLSWVFFVIGSVFGITISILLPLLDEPLFGIRSEVIAIIFQLTFVALFFSRLEDFFKIIKKVI